MRNSADKLLLQYIFTFIVLGKRSENNMTINHEKLC